jgi:DnaJ-class molecular chaperone
MEPIASSSVLPYRGGMSRTHEKPCDRCGGKGTKVREKRRLTDGSADPTDVVHWPEELCDKCGGAGVVSYVPQPQEAVNA